MDILRFVNSNAIREHLKKINYQFNTLEAAYLIALCQDATFSERHEAWQEVIDTMPDMCPEEELPRCKHYYLNSIHAFLKKRIAYENELLAEYLSIKEGAFKFQPYYSYEFKDRCGLEDSSCFGTMETDAERLDAYIADYIKNEDDLEYQSFQKYRIVCKSMYTEKEFVAAYNRKGRILDVCVVSSDLNCDENNIIYGFDDMWFDIPTPFKKGDILYDPDLPFSLSGLWGGPFVYKISAADYYKKEKIKGKYNYTDMTVSGYFQVENGILREGKTYYLNLEYYPVEQLKGFNRALIALSYHLKGNFDDVLFANAYHELLMENYINTMYPCHRFADEGLMLAGIKAEEDIEDGTDDLPF